MTVRAFASCSCQSRDDLALVQRIDALGRKPGCERGWGRTGEQTHMTRRWGVQDRAVLRDHAIEERKIGYEATKVFQLPSSGQDQPPADLPKQGQDGKGRLLQLAVPGDGAIVVGHECGVGHVVSYGRK